MQEKDDITLLREFASNNSEAAFETLVGRHLHFVYSAALRQVRDPHLAEDVAQAVFIVLAKKAGSIGDRTVLSGWLFKTTRYVALTQTRARTRRFQHEQEAHVQFQDQTNPSDPLWEQISPLLDEALAQLGEKDRQAVLLRFFEDKTFAEVGASFGAGEDATRMRINRALERLRRFFLKRGVTATAAIIAGAITSHSIQAAPVALAKTITSVAVMKGSAAGGSTLALAKGALTIMAWTKIKTTVVVGACVLLAAGTVSVAVYNMPTRIQRIPSDWSALDGNRSQWSSAGGLITGQSTTDDSILASTREYRNVTVSAVVSTTNREASIALRMQDAHNGYIVLFVPPGTPWADENGCHVSLVKRMDGRELNLGLYKGPRISSVGQSAKLTVSARGSEFEVQLNGARVLRAVDKTFDSGMVGFRIYGDPIKPCNATFSNVTIR